MIYSPHPSCRLWRTSETDRVRIRLGAAETREDLGVPSETDISVCITRSRVILCYMSVVDSRRVARKAE